MSLDRYYVGHSKNILDRIKRHNAGWSKATKAGIPWKLMYEEAFDTKSAAYRRELAIKAKKSKIYIESLIGK